MARSHDEPFTLYGLIAAIGRNRRRARLRDLPPQPRARISPTARAITADDVRFTFELLRDEGPAARSAPLSRWSNRVTTPDPLTIRFDLAGADDRELPLILALMPALLAPPHRRGAFRRRDAGRSRSAPAPIVVDERRSRPAHRLSPRPQLLGRATCRSTRGLYNFDRIAIDYYPRRVVAVRRLRRPGSSTCGSRTTRALAHAPMIFPRRRRGEVIRSKSLPVGLPKGMSGFAFNTRRAVFADVRVREALASMFDFEWINATLFGGAYSAHAELFRRQRACRASAGRRAPRSGRCSRRFPARCATTFSRAAGGRRSPTAPGRDRARARAALAELGAAGYALQDGALRDAARPRRSASKSWSRPAPRSGSPLSYARDAGAHRRRRAGAAGRRDRVPAPAPAVRFRHDPGELPRLAPRRARSSAGAGARRRRTWRAPTTSPARARRRSTR